MSLIATLISLAAAAALPTAPADGIRDDARVFGDLTRTELVKEMTTLQSETGVRLFIDTNTYLDSGTTTTDRCRALLNEWGKDVPAVVICLDRSSSAPPTVQISGSLWTQYGTLEIMKAQRNAVGKMEASPVTGEHVAAGARSLITDITKYAKTLRARDRVLNRRDTLLAGAFGAALLLGGGLLWLLVRFLGRHETQQAVQHTFPDVEVGQRFGAPCGGGVIVEIAFRKQ
jgi:hypothetical protein